MTHESDPLKFAQDAIETPGQNARQNARYPYFAEKVDPLKSRKMSTPYNSRAEDAAHSLAPTSFIVFLIYRFLVKVNRTERRKKLCAARRARVEPRSTCARIEPRTEPRSRVRAAFIFFVKHKEIFLTFFCKTQGNISEFR